jgi:adenylyl-sulfate kinase
MVKKRGYTIWFTGLSASGKTTISHCLEKELMEHLESKLHVIDGDYMRKTINRDLGYTREQRNIATERIAYVAKILNDNGIICIVSNISQDKGIRTHIRKIIEDFVLVYVDTPVEVCAQRCYKGHYEKAINGEVKDFVGITEEYEKPDDAEIIIDTLSTSPEKAADIIVNYLKKCGKVD